MTKGINTLSDPFITPTHLEICHASYVQFQPKSIIETTRSEIVTKTWAQYMEISLDRDNSSYFPRILLMMVIDKKTVQEIATVPRSMFPYFVLDSISIIVFQ